MRVAIQLSFWVVGIPLEVLTIGALIRGWYKRFPFIFAYVIALFLATAIEVPTFLGSYLKLQIMPRTPAYYYWWNEGVLQLLIFSVVVSLVYLATARLASRRLMRVLVIALPALFAAGSILVHYTNEDVTGAWMTPWVRDLSFCSAFLDLGLWALLIASRDKDYKLLMLSGALGIQFTGEAIGGALRSLSQPTHSRAIAYTGTILIGLANLTCLYIWWQTFREKPTKGSRLSASV